jgi:hypothetical protein
MWGRMGACTSIQSDTFANAFSELWNAVALILLLLPLHAWYEALCTGDTSGKGDCDQDDCPENESSQRFFLDVCVCWYTLSMKSVGSLQGAAAASRMALAQCDEAEDTQV